MSTQQNERPYIGETVYWQADNFGGDAVVKKHHGTQPNGPLIEADRCDGLGSITLYPDEYDLTKTESEAEHEVKTRKHIQRVKDYIGRFGKKMEARANVHDQSKLEEPEASTFAEVNDNLEGLTYGSDEYHEQLECLGSALDHHYSNNSHHPQHYDDGIAGMTLHDLVEMWCDWQAAVERHDDGDIHASIDHNKERFDMSPQLVQIFRNTAERS